MNTAEELRIEARIADVSCDDSFLHVGLENGRTISVPLRWYPRLAQASPAQHDAWELAGAGYGVHWPEIDEDLSAEGLLLGWAAPGVVK